jgi:cell volume regulation protein A
MNLFLLAGAALVFISILLTPISTRIGAPLLLLFLLLGMLVGEDGPGDFHFEDISLAYNIGSVALALILFSGCSRQRTSAVLNSCAMHPRCVLVRPSVGTCYIDVDGQM